MTNEEHLSAYVQELINVRTQLELAIVKLKNELESWISGKQTRPSTGASPIGPGEVHQISTSPETPGTMPQGINQMVDASGSQVAPTSPPSS